MIIVSLLAGLAFFGGIVFSIAAFREQGRIRSLRKVLSAPKGASCTDDTILKDPPPESLLVTSEQAIYFEHGASMDIPNYNATQNDESIAIAV